MPQSQLFKFRARRGFTLIEILVILIIIALLLVIVVPHIFMVFKERKASRVRNDLVTLNAAIEHYALDNGKASGMQPTFDDLRKYLNPKSDIYVKNGRNAFGDTYGPFIVGSRPMVPKKTADELTDIVDNDYWSPYQYQVQAAPSPGETTPTDDSAETTGTDAPGKGATLR